MNSDVLSQRSVTPVYASVAAALSVFLITLYYNREEAKRIIFPLWYGKFITRLLVILLHPLKRKHFSVLKTLKSHDPKMSTLRILEIGIGSGINLQYYPEGTRLISVEPNPHFETYFSKNLEKFRHVKVEKFIRGKAEDMAEIEDGSIDVVVSTYVMCSVDDCNAALKEIRRVLAPGGRYLYFEHVSFPTGSFGRIFQKTIQPFWALITNNCRLTNSTSTFIKAAGFYCVEESYTFASVIIYPIRPHLIGTAFK